MSALIIVSAEDGVLDLSKIWPLALMRSVGETVGKHLDDPEVRLLMRNGPRAGLKALLGPGSGRLAYDIFTRRYLELVQRSQVVVPGMATRLGARRRSGAQVVAVSALNRRPLARSMWLAGLTEVVGLAFAEEDLPDWPPDPSMLLRVLSRTATADSDATLYTDHGLWRVAGRRAGLRVQSVSEL